MSTPTIDQVLDAIAQAADADFESQEDRRLNILAAIRASLGPEPLRPTPRAPARRVWLLDVRATCLVDATSEEGAREAWEDGLEYEYTIDTEGGILNIEPYLDQEARLEGAPGEVVLSVTGDELEVLRECLKICIKGSTSMSQDYEPFASVFDKVASRGSIMGL